MPQLNPMNWFILFSIFNFSFFLLVMKINFLSDKIISKKAFKYMKKTYNFKL